MHHTPDQQTCDLHAAQPFFETILRAALPPSLLQPASVVHRGRPLEVSHEQLWLSLLLAVLLGMNSYQDLWRTMRQPLLDGCEPIQVTDDALIKRFKRAGLQPLEETLSRLGACLAPHLASVQQRTTELAPFASRIVALDETTWDAVQRHLAPLRCLPDGDARLLPGKLAGRFDVRRQQWDFVQWRVDPQANCKVDVCSLLHELPPFSLLLFDLGYFSFPWLDYLTQLNYSFVCRLREKTTYRLAHVFYQHEGILDALVWLGSPKGAHCGQLVRLVRFHDGTDLRCYLTNVLDPRQLSLPDVARLYARRWDIELAILTIKDLLHLQHWWSSQPVLIQQQAFAVLIVAQLVQAVRLLAAAQAGCDPFEVSLPLLVQFVPQFIFQRLHPLRWMGTYGHVLGLIRPASRRVLQLPCLDLAQYVFAPAELALTRKACYLEYVPTPGRSSRAKKKSAQVPNNSS